MVNKKFQKNPKTVKPNLSVTCQYSESRKKRGEIYFEKERINMKKKVISLLLALCILCGCLPVAGFAAGGFSDVPDNIWFAKAVAYCAEKNYMNGIGGMRFNPSGGVSRAMVAQVLWNIAGNPEPVESNPFTDVADNEWFTKAVTWCAENKITSGTTATTFSPNSNVTREQICTLVMNYKNLDNTLSFDDDIAWLTNFTDKRTVSKWAKSAMIWAYQTGFISGTSDTTLSPGGRATRAQLAQFLYNLENGTPREKPDPTQPVGGPNTRWTAELAPVQNTDLTVVKEGYTFIDEEGWYVPVETDEPAYYDKDGNPSKARKKIDVLKKPIEMYTFTRRNIGGGMLPYFNAAEKDLKPVPADGVINTGMPYWTILGIIPYGGYVENGRIYLPMHEPLEKHYWWDKDNPDHSNEDLQRLNARYANETKYDWRIDVTSIDGKMTSQEKEMFDTFNQWRVERGCTPYQFDEQAQILAELYALIQCCDDYAKKDAVASGLKAPKKGFTYMFGNNLHTIMNDPDVKEFSSVAGASFAILGSFGWPFSAYNPNREGNDMMVENNQAWSTGYSAAGICAGFKSSPPHYNSISTSHAITCGVGTVCRGGGIIACSEVQDRMVGSDLRYFRVPVNVIIKDATTIECPNCGRVFTDVKVGIWPPESGIEEHEGRLNGQGIPLGLESCPFCSVNICWEEWDRLYR